MEGNGKQFIRQLPTGAKNTTTPINRNNFNPTEQTPNLIEQFQINLFTNTSTPQNPEFAPEAFCFQKEQTIPETEYYEVFRTGNPSKFFTNLRGFIYKSFILFMYDKLATMITTLDNYDAHSKIAGTGNNAFEC